jgi:hypothetical protein
MLFEKPGLGLGHFYYVPVAMVALADGAAWGAPQGSRATGFYTVGIVLNPHIATSQVLTAGSIVRLITYTSMGVLVGWFAPTTATSPTAFASPASATTSPAC